MILLGAFCFSLAPIFARAVEGFSTAAIAFYRALFAALTFLFITHLAPAHRKQLAFWRWPKREAALMLALGLAMGLTSLFYTHAYLHTTVARAVLLNYTAPLYVAVASPWLLKEPWNRRSLIAVPMGLAGIILITDPAQLFVVRSDETGGILAGLASGVTFAIVFILGRYLAPRVLSTVRTFLGAVVMSAMFLPWGVQAPKELLLQNLPWLAGLGFFALALPYFFIFQGQKYVPAQVGSTVALFEPLCGVIIGYLVFGETLTPWGIAGAALILISIFLVSTES